MKEIDFRSNRERIIQRERQRKIEMRKEKMLKIVLIASITFCIIMILILNYVTKDTSNEIYRKCIENGNGIRYCERNA